MSLDNLRAQIDEIDKGILILLEKRFQIAKDIQKSKSTFGLPVSDQKREAKVLERLEKLSASLNLQFSFVRQLYALIFKQSRIIQTVQR